MEFQIEREFRSGCSVSSVAFSPNGAYLAAADLARLVCLWDMKTRKKKWETELPPVGAVSEEDVALTFTADSKMLLVASYVRNPVVLDASSGKRLRAIGHNGEWFAPAISLWRQDGMEMAVTSWSGDLHFWNPANGREVLILKGAGLKVISLHVAKRAARIALGLQALGPEDGADTGRVLVRELPSGRVVFDVRQSQSPVRHLAISPDGEYLVGASDEELVCWSIPRKERLWSTEAVWAGLAMSPDGKLLAYSSGSLLALCDVPTGKRLSSTYYGSHTITAVAFAEDGTSIAVGADDGTVATVAVWRVSPTREKIEADHKYEKQEDSSPVAAAEPSS